jgi:hypothetical protein
MFYKKGCLLASRLTDIIIFDVHFEAIDAQTKHDDSFRMDSSWTISASFVSTVLQMVQSVIEID